MALVYGSRMNRFAIVVALAACSGGHKPTATAGSGSGLAVYGKRFVLAWSIAPAEGGASSNVYITGTDETGKATSYPLGTFPGTCQVFEPSAEMKAVTGVACTAPGGARAELHAIGERDEVIVLQLDIPPGGTADAMNRREVTRIAAPPGSKIEVAAAK